MSETRITEAIHRTAGVHIDPRAMVAPNAKLFDGVKIGAFAIVGEDVELGEGCELMPHAVVRGPARIGKNNVFHSFCSIGGDPQDLKYAGERTHVVIGDANQFREGVTVNRGTGHGSGTTTIGSHNLFMVYAHIAHDCQVGDSTVFANSATLAGHVSIQDYATIGAFSAVHQFCRVGRYAYVGGFTVVTQDVPPFGLVVSERNTHCLGMNKVGLERRGFSPERMAEIEKAYRLLLRAKLNTSQAVGRMRETLNGSADVQELIAFIEAVERGLVK